MRTLRSRLILSHLLPVLLVVPLVGAVLVYLLQTQLWLGMLSDNLLQEAVLTSVVVGDRPLIWGNSFEAQRFLTLLGAQSPATVTLYDSQGNLWASSGSVGSSAAGQTTDLALLAGALAGEPQVRVSTTQGLAQEVIQAAVPVVDAHRHVLGVVHLSQQVSSLQGQFGRMRQLIIGTLAAELALGLVLGLALALNLGRSLQRVTTAIDGVASGRQWETLPVQGPDEIRTLLRAFNALTERLRLLEQSRRRLLANLVHELGRPLGALQSGLQALLSGAAEDARLRQELLLGMDEQVRRLRPLLDTLADLHGQVLGPLELDLQPVELGEWLRLTALPWRQPAEDKGLAWSVVVPETPCVLEVDAGRLAQALGNLLSNAVKYTAEGSISVEARFEEDHVAIQVKDTGLGIEPSEHSKIFEPFYRSRRDKRFPQGMGLGLSIARDVVAAHGGRLEVESAPGQGSLFTIHLPRPGPAGHS
jgi:two-component system, OmpR family, sensor histidine kinase BaeS